MCISMYSCTFYCNNNYLIIIVCACVVITCFFFKVTIISLLILFIINESNTLKLLDKNIVRNNLLTRSKVRPAEYGSSIAPNHSEVKTTI